MGVADVALCFVSREGRVPAERRGCVHHAGGQHAPVRLRTVGARLAGEDTPTLPSIGLTDMKPTSVRLFVTLELGAAP